MIEQIVLLVIGGIITLAFTSLYNRLTRKSAEMTWRILPPVKLRAQELTAFNIVIANEGNDAAKNVRVVVNLPDDVNAEVVELHPSEAALRYSIRNLSAHGHSVEIEIPVFHSNVDCVLSFLTRAKQYEMLALSLTADDNLVGQEAEHMTDNTFKVMRRKVRRYQTTTFAFLGGYTLILVMWSTLQLIHERTRDQALTLGDLCHNLGRYDDALAAYADIHDNWFTPGNERVIYSIARTYAAMTNANASIELLKQLPWTDKKYLLACARRDPSFKAIQDNAEFRAIVFGSEGRVTK